MRQQLEAVAPGLASGGAERERLDAGRAGAINIDVRAEVVVELQGRVTMDGLRPVLGPGKYQEPRWNTQLARFVGDVTLIVSRRKKRRSDAANAYLWGVVYEDILAGLRQIALESGEKCPFRDKDELHDAMKYVHLGTEIVKVGDVEIERPATTVLPSDQFGLYVSAVKRMAAERWRIYVREPGEAA